MTFRERLGTWIAGQRATEALEMHAMTGVYFGLGLGSTPDQTTLLEENIGVADMATRAIANRVGSLNPLVKVSRRASDGTQEDEILDDHPMKILLDRPHPNLSWFQLGRLTAQYIVTVGEGYLLKVGDGLGVTRQLHPIPANKVSPILSKNITEGYIVLDGAGKQHEIDAGDMIRFFFPDPENPWRSEGYLAPNGIETDAMKFASQHLRQHYQNDATPKTALKVENPDIAPKMTDVQIERFLDLWRQKYHTRLGTGQGRPGVLPPGYALIQMALQSGADMQPLLEFWSDGQLMNFGTPKSILGKVVSGDRSSAETNQYVFDRYTILPIATLIQQGLTNQLAHDFDPALFCEFEPFVSEDKHFTLEKQTADLRDKVRSINQVREDDGLDPVPWGEEPVGKIGEMPYDPDLAYDFGEDVPEAIDTAEPKEEPDEPRIRSRGEYFAPEAEWQRQLAREKAYVPSFGKEMRAVFGIQERDALKKLRATEPRSRVIAGQIFDPSEWAALFQKRVEPVRARAFEVILGETLGGLGIDDFVLTDEMRFLLQQQAALLVQHTNRTTQTMIARQLAEGTAEGEGVDQLAKRIKAVFRTRRKHARTIARTEVLKASQEAQIAGFETSGVVEKKRWNTSLDAAVRDSHQYAEGQVRGLREPFDLEGEAADAPGIGFNHGHLSAGNSINCRCFVTPVLED